MHEAVLNLHETPAPARASEAKGGAAGHSESCLASFSNPSKCWARLKAGLVGPDTRVKPATSTNGEGSAARWLRSSGKGNAASRLASVSRSFRPRQFFVRVNRAGRGNRPIGDERLRPATVIDEDRRGGRVLG